MTTAETHPQSHWDNVFLARDARTLESMLRQPRLSATHREMATISLERVYAELDSRWAHKARESRCQTCEHGCNCVGGKPGCGHYACWGQVSGEVANSCPAAVVMRDLAAERMGTAVETYCACAR
jgi:hypothetical protein